MIPEHLDFIGAAVLVLHRDEKAGLVIEQANPRACSLFSSTPAIGFILGNWAPELDEARTRRVVPLSRRPGPCQGTQLEGVIERLLPLRVMLTLRETAHGGEGPPSAEQGIEALAILDRQSEMIARWRVDGTIYYCNDAYARQCGLPKERVLGANLLVLTPPGELGQILANIRRLGPERPVAAYVTSSSSPTARGAGTSGSTRRSSTSAGRLRPSSRSAMT